jgi:hypothetical protein
VVTTNSQGEWGRWDNPDGPNEITADGELFYNRPADTPLTEARQMRKNLEWPVRNGELDRRGADVLSGFSGQVMGTAQSSGIRGELIDIFSDQYVDARSGTPEGERYPGPLQSDGTFDDDYELTGGVTIIGTNDPPVATDIGSVDNIYMHELGHVLGAIHPNDTIEEDEDFELPENEPGVMCKAATCALVSREWILNSKFYSEPNKDRILNLYYDQKDADNPLDKNKDEDPDGSINEARNLGTVAKAASTETPENNRP